MCTESSGQGYLFISEIRQELGQTRERCTVDETGEGVYIYAHKSLIQSQSLAM